MKKILSLLALVLLSCMGAWAQTTVELTTDESNPHFYKIESYNRGGVLTSNGEGQSVTHVDMGDGGYWYFTAAEGNSTNTVAGGVIVHNNDGTKLTDSWTTAAEGSVLYILPNGVNNYGLSICKHTTIQGSDCIDAQNGGRTGVGNWAPSASDWEGTTWKFTPVETGFAGYKSEAKEGINAYYLASESLKTNAIAQIDAATDEAGVDAAVAAALTAYQNEVAGKYWFIQSGYSEYYKQQSVYKCFIYDGSNKTTWGNQEDNNPNCYYKLEIAAGGKICIKSNDGKYMQGVAGAMSTTKVEASLTSYPDGTFNIVFSNGTCHTEGHGGGAGVSGNLVSWSGGAGSASSWKFIEKTQADYEAAVNAVVQITYNYYIDGVKFNTTVASARIGQAYPAANNYAGYTITGAPTGNVTGDGSYDLTLGDFAGPFVPTTLSGDAFADGTKWYYMYHPHTSAYVYYLNDSDKKSGFNATETNDPAYKWTFVRKQGSPYFYLYNKQAGAVAMREQLSTDSRYYPTHNQGFVVANVEAAEMPLELFTNGTGYGFRLAAVDGVCILGKHTDAKLSIWGNSANKGDNGSRFTFTEVPEVAPADPVEFVTSLNDKYTYAIVNVQPEGVHNWYLNSVDGVLTPADASACNAETEWAETAQFVAEFQEDGKVAFKNVANGQYLAYVNHERAKCENGGKGFVDGVEEWSAWTIGNASTRAGYENTFYPMVSKRWTTYSGNASTLLIANNGAWNGWGNTECTNTGFSNNYGFVLVKEYVAPEFDPAKKYTIENTADKRGKLAFNPAGANYVGLADVTYNTTFAGQHASSSDPEVGIEWQLTQVGADKVTLKNLKNDKYAVIQDNKKCVWSDTPYEYVFTKYEGYYTLQGNGTPSSEILTLACGWQPNGGPVYLEGTTVKNEHKLIIAEVEEPVAPSYTEEEIAALQEEIDGLLETAGTVGYPDPYSDEAGNLFGTYSTNFENEVTAANYEAAQAALTAYYNCTDVVLPEAGKSYEIKAVYHDGKKQYLGFDGTKLSITDTKPMGGSVTFKAVSVTDNNVVFTIADKYVHWTAGDDPRKAQDTDGLNETLDDNLNTLVLTKATPGTSAGSRTPKATTENLFGLLQIQGKSSGTENKNQLFYFVTRNLNNGNGTFVAANNVDKFFDANWNDNGENRTTYFEITEVEEEVDAPATQEERYDAYELLWGAGRLGFPKDDDPVVAALSAAIEKEGVTATELGAAVIAYKNCTNVVVPEKGRFYRLFGGSTSGVLAGGSHLARATMIAGVNPDQGPTEIDLATLYYYSEEGYLINYNGGLALKGAQLVLSSETPDVFTFCHETLTELGTLCIKNASGNYLLDQNNNVSTVSAEVGQATNWVVDNYGYAPIKVGASGYATAYMPFGLASAPEYHIKGVYVAYKDGDVLKAEALDFIPAKTPIIIETTEPNTICFGKGYGEDNYTVDDELQAKLDANVLAGTLIAMPKPENALVLGIANDVLGFYRLNGTVLDGFKAYYPNATLSNGMAIRFDDTLTAIESAIETAKGNEIFDLQGRRVNGAAHGLFIQNGKKIVK